MNALLKALVDGVPADSVPAASALGAEKPPLQKIRYSHEAMIDLLISQPWIKQNDIALHFGMSASWISTIICSDLFQSKLAERREQLIDPDLRLSIKTQMEGLHARSMEILRHKLDRDPDQVPDQLALQVAKVMGQGLGMGVRAEHVSVHETHVHLEELGNNLVGLLRRRRATAEEIVDGEVLPSKPQDGPHPLQLNQPPASPGPSGAEAGPRTEAPPPG